MTKRGFGTPLADGKRDIINRKKPGLIQSDAVERAVHGYGGNDSVVPPEATSVPPTEPATDGKISVSADELRVLVAAEAKKQAEQLNQSLVDQNQALQADYDHRQQLNQQEQKKLQDEAAAAKKEADRLKSVFSATGNSIPSGSDAGQRQYGFSVNTLILPSAQEPQGAAKDFYDILNNTQYTPRATAYDQQDGTEYEQLDTQYLDRYLRENKKAVIADMEKLFKAHGFLRGGSRDAQAGSTLGTAGSIQAAFLPFLSAVMRLSHVPRYVWWQFVVERLELGRVPGNNILVPRFQWLDEPTDPSDYILDTATSSATISSDSQAMQMTTSPVELLGYGLGKGNRIGNRPIAIPEFVLASSMVDLVQALNTRLGQNYNALEDLIIRQIFQQTLVNPNNIYYNEAGSITTTPGNINVGEDGTMTEEALNSLSAEMTRRGIPTYEIGCRVGVLNTFASSQLKNSLGDKLRAQTEAEIQEVTNVLNAGNLGDGIVKPTGYLGMYCNFMLFESGTTAVGAPGSEGVNSVTFGAGARTARDNFFFGPGVAGKGVSLPMEVRMDDSGTFGTKMKFIWRSIEGWGSLDCTSTTAGQQDRCLVLRNTDQPI